MLLERDAARRDSRLKARFLSYRLNVPTSDESEVLLTVADWEMVEGREVPPREGRPMVAADLGSGRAWSAAVSLWPNGRLEALALAPGIPNLESQERRDRVPSGNISGVGGNRKVDDCPRLEGATAAPIVGCRSVHVGASGRDHLRPCTVGRTARRGWWGCASNA